MKQLALIALLLSTGPAAAQHAGHQDPDVARRGDAVMGFSHQKTIHHFRLRADGGEIEVTAADSRDEESVAQIRGHLRHVAQMFADGNFTAPMLIHARNPPGADLMKARKDAITYVPESIPSGAIVRIRTKDRQALAAIHAFLRFQITDHATGDPLTIQR